jgi:hypothetical protein
LEEKVQVLQTYTTATEEYNGATWATVHSGSLNTVRLASRRLLELKQLHLAVGGDAEVQVCYRMQQKNIMVQLGQQVQDSFKYSKIRYGI